jgi:hypothetical protein
LKEKFGTGYIFEVRINLLREDQFLMLMSNLFMHQAALIERFSDRFQYNIPKECIKALSFVFDKLEKAKSDMIVVEYSFSQCTLEQIFIKFAKEQTS